MRVEKFSIEGPILFTPKQHGDERGFFAETFRAKDFEKATSLTASFVQDNLSVSTEIGSYAPNDKRNPLNAYSRSKAAGERAVIAAGGQSLILRTSWVYDGTGKNFLTTMLRLAKQRAHLDIVNDQFGRPTYAGHLAESCIAALEHMPSSPKIYHVSNSGPIISWADFAAAIFERAKLYPEINPVTAAQFSSRTQRPANSVLDISDFEQNFHYPLEPWEIGLELAFHEMRISAKDGL